MKKAEREELLRRKLAEMKAFERPYYEKGAETLAGVDEAGRGPLAGPVVAACVVLSPDFDILGVDDSKRLNEKKRKELASVIQQEAFAYGLAMADEKTIDEINILEATKGAMRMAVERANEMLLEKTGNAISHVLLDAITLSDMDLPQTAIVGGDGKSISIAAASILAKVTRDALMVKYSEEYPGYAFERNKGYGTKTHYEGIERQGLCPIHRRSFLRKYAERFDK